MDIFLFFQGSAEEDSILRTIRFAPPALIASALVDLGDFSDGFIDHDRPGGTNLSTVAAA